MKHPGLTLGKPQSAWTWERLLPVQGLTWRSGWQTGPCRVLCRLRRLWVSTWYPSLLWGDVSRTHTSQPTTHQPCSWCKRKSRSGRRFMLCLPRIVGAWYNNAGLMLYLVWPRLKWKRFSEDKLNVLNCSSVPLWETATGMIRRVILRMKDWLSNAARVKLWSLSGSQPSTPFVVLPHFPPGSAASSCLFSLAFGQQHKGKFDYQMPN